MSDRFDLEEGIMDCWSITKDIEHLNKAVLEYDLTKDQISNVLTGLVELYNIKFDSTFNTFSDLIKKKVIL